MPGPEGAPTRLATDVRLICPGRGIPFLCGSFFGPIAIRDYSSLIKSASRSSLRVTALIASDTT